MMASVQVLGVKGSPYVHRALIALREKGVEFELVLQDLTDKSDLLLTSNPLFEKVPVLLHNGKPICDSKVIVQYIDEVWPGHGSLFPDDPVDRAHHRLLAEFIESKMFVNLVKVIVSRNSDEASIADMKAGFVALNDVLGDRKPFLGGESLGYADIMFAPFLYPLDAFVQVGWVEPADEKLLPNLVAYMNALKEHPSVKPTFDFITSDAFAKYLQSL